jgi:hypothetical protein
VVISLIHETATAPSGDRFDNRGLHIRRISRAMAAASDHHEASPVSQGAGVLPNIFVRGAGRIRRGPAA